MPSLKLSNPFRRVADRPTLKQRAADLKAGLASAAQATPATDQETDTESLDANPELVSLVTTWLDVRRRYEAVTQDDQTEEGDALFEQILLLQPAIFAFPVASVADLCAKLPVLRDEFDDIAIGPDPAKPYWLRQAADAVLRDLASLATTTALTPPADPTDWHAPPPGFMAYPAIDPQGFVIVREGLRLELERLHRIALAEYARKVGPDAREATRARVRRELRLPLFEAASPNGDAEILALGLDLDAAHARWRAATPAYWAAQERVRQACDRAKERGGSVHAANVAVWDEPGVREADRAFEAIGGELERISKAIWGTLARTPLGLAVKARATLVMVFVSGEYERDSHLGNDEDLTEQATRALVEACCALAGVDWKGQPVGADEALTTPSAFDVDTSWAKAQAAAVDLSGLTVLQLHNLFGCYAAAADTWLSSSAEPWLQRDADSPYRDPNAAGRLIDREQDRAARIRDRIAEELRGRKPTTETERDYRLETLIRYEIMCEGSLRHAPAVRAEITRAWGG